MKTFLVLGNMRGGTSSVAGLLRIMGVNMGDNISEYCHEDLDLQHRHPYHMKDLVDEKNAKYDTWGWKDPLAIDWIDDLCDMCDLRNPIVLVVFRDVVANAEGLARREGWDYNRAVNYVQQQNGKLVKFMNDYGDKFTIHPLSYEKILEYPEDIARFIGMLAGVEFATDGIDVRLERACQFIKKGYRQLPPPKDRSRVS